MGDCMNSRIYKKIFFSFSIIIIIYTAIIILTVINKEVNRRKYESVAEIEFYLEREASLIDSKFEVAITSTKLLAENKVIQKLISGNENSLNIDYGLYSDIFDQFRTILFSGYQTQYNLGITSGIDQMVIGPNGYFLFNDYLNFIELDSGEQIINDFFSSKDLNNIKIFSSGPNLYLLRKIYIPESQKALFFILNWQESNVVDLQRNYAEGEFFFISNDSIKGEDALLIEPFLPLGDIKKNGIGNKTTNGNSLFWKRSTYISDLNYALVLPNRLFSQVPTDTILFIIGVLIVLLILGFLLTIYFSHRSYGPYKKIIMEISKDSTEYIDVDGVLKTIEDLKTINYDLSHFKQSTIVEIRELFLKNIVIGKYSTDDLKRIIPIIGWQKIDSGGVISVLTIHGKTSAETHLNEKKLSEARQKIIEYAGSTEEVQIYVQSLGIDKFVLIYLTKRQDLIINAMSTIRHILSKELSISCSFVMSTPFNNLDEFPSTLRGVIGLNAEIVLKNDDFDISSSIDNEINYVYSIEAEQRLINLVKLKEFDNANELIESILKINFIEKQLSTYVIADLKQVLLNTIKRLTYLSSVNFPSFYNKNRNLFERLIGTDSSDLYQTYTLIYEELFLLLKNENTESFEVIDRVLSYIDKHFIFDLSLSELADKFNLTESYVSRLIKDATGIPFKNYINQLKVNRAKELLDSKKMKVSEVSYAVGCKNVNTFIRIFKQYEGITPGKYQNYSQSTEEE